MAVYFHTLFFIVVIPVLSILSVFISLIFDFSILISLLSSPYLYQLCTFQNRMLICLAPVRTSSSPCCLAARMVRNGWLLSAFGYFYPLFFILLYINHINHPLSQLSLIFTYLLSSLFFIKHLYINFQIFKNIQL